MRNFSTWLLVCFIVMFWAFRVFVTLMFQLHQDMGGIVPLNETLEIILIFVVLLCIILIVKRKMVGALIYLLSYGMYFGVDLFNNIKILMEGDTEISMATYTSMFISFIAIILAVAVTLDMLADKNRKAHPKDKKTDWFYKNEQFDRKLDDRADKNNYRTM